MDITGHELNVRQGSCQAMWSQWIFCCGADERRTRRQISGGSGHEYVFGGRIEKKARFLGCNKSTEEFVM